jgi:hypothetical protein
VVQSSVLGRRSGQAAPTWTQAGVDAFARYRWPGNVRELANIVERLSILFAGQSIGAAEVASVLPAGEHWPEVRGTFRPLPGPELADWSTKSIQTGRADDGRNYYHLGLIARNLTGYQNLLKLVSDAHLRGFYYKPRADFETLARYADGLIGFTGCLAALVPQHLMHNRFEEARKATARFVDLFGRENFLVEIQDHGIPERGPQR